MVFARTSSRRAASNSMSRVRRRQSLPALIIVALLPMMLQSWAAAATCGDGQLEPTEECDDGNLVAGDCCSPTCMFEPADTICRPATDVCDVPETCTGTSAPCPPDAFAATSVVCRSAAGICDVTEACPGDGPACPPDVFAPSSLECRAAAGPCDAPESCPGDGPACPPDVFAPSSLECRAAAGPCDAPESCPGDGPACPPDGYAASSKECRPATGPCDVPEFCLGSSAACPVDEVQPEGTQCPDDGIPCTDDVCDAGGSCTHRALDARCSSADCSLGHCDASQGCVAEPRPDATTCDDGDECTLDDSCVAGSCAAGREACATVTASGSRLVVVCLAVADTGGSCSARAFVASPVPGSRTPISKTRFRRIRRGRKAQLMVRLDRNGRKLLAVGPLLVDVEVEIARNGWGFIVQRRVTLQP